MEDQEDARAPELRVRGTVTGRLQPPEPGDGTRPGLAVKWRRHADALHARANELGDCRNGLALAVEAGTWRQAADELEVSMLQPPPTLLDELAALASRWRRQYEENGPDDRARDDAALQQRDDADELAALLARVEARHG